jgi:acetyltransferase EpsM
VAICGAGGHGKVVADVLPRHVPEKRIAGFFDDRVELHGITVAGLRVLGSIRDSLQTASPALLDLFLAIGDNRSRERLAQEAMLAGFSFVSAIHPSAQIGAGVEIGSGTVVMPNAVINADARVGAHVIVNTGASIDHDCVVEDFSHLSPGVHLAGNVTVRRGAHIGIGACVIPGVCIGEWAVIGAGATVIRDVPACSTVVGTPAAPIKQRKVVR